MRLPPEEVERLRSQPPAEVVVEVSTAAIQRCLTHPPEPVMPETAARLGMVIAGNELGRIAARSQKQGRLTKGEFNRAVGAVRLFADARALVVGPVANADDAAAKMLGELSEAHRDIAFVVRRQLEAEGQRVRVVNGVGHELPEPPPLPPGFMQ